MNIEKDSAVVKFDAQGVNWRAHLLFADCLVAGHLKIADSIRVKYGDQFPSTAESIFMFGFYINYEPVA